MFEKEMERQWKGHGKERARLCLAVLGSLLIKFVRIQLRSLPLSISFLCPIHVHVLSISFRFPFHFAPVSFPFPPDSFQFFSISSKCPFHVLSIFFPFPFLLYFLSVSFPYFLSSSFSFALQSVRVQPELNKLQEYQSCFSNSYILFNELENGWQISHFISFFKIAGKQVMFLFLFLFF